jgi:hypothetical protein
MWFALALFAFCLVYALINKINSNLFDLEIFKEQKLYNLIHFFLIILIAVVAFIIRLYLPIGTIVWGMQYCYFSSYIFLFFAGVIAGRTGYIENISSKELRNWLYAGIGVYLAGWLIMVLSSPLYDPSASSAGMSKSLMAFHGGMNFKSAFFALVESFVAVSMTLGLLGFFKDKINFTNSITKKLSDGAFGVYMFHPPIIIAVTLYLQPLMFMPFIKWIIAGMISIPLCFAIAYYVLLKIPVLNKIL